jgi:hypothetical protein
LVKGRTPTRSLKEIGWRKLGLGGDLRISLIVQLQFSKYL